MREFKSSLFVIGKNVAYGIGGALLVALVLSWFINTTIAVVLGIAAGAAIIYLAVHSNNIRVVVDGDAVAFFRGEKELHRFTLADHSFHAKIVTTTGSGIPDSDCDLTVTAPDGTETEIDCSMLGHGRFMELLDCLGFNNQPPTPVATVKKAD